MNDAKPPTGLLRRAAPLAAVVAIGIALAVFAGLSAGDDGNGNGTAGTGVGYEGPQPPVDRATLLAAEAASLPLPEHPPLQLDPAEAPTIDLDGPGVELRVLVLVHGADQDADAAAQVIETLDVVGIAHDVVFTDDQVLTEAMLRDGDRGRYNGIILTDAELLGADGTSGMEAAEWSLLEDYTRDFSVRQAVLGGFPGSTDAHDYGMGAVEVIDDTEARWTAAAAGPFASVARDADLQLSGSSFAATPRNDGFGPTVEPLLVDSTGERALISLLGYPDGRETLLSGIAMGPSHRHSHALVYDFVRFATSGLHLGAARTHLAVHVDDLFFDYRAWDTEANRPEPDTTRNTPADIEAVIAHQERLASQFDTLDSFVTDFPFNGAGAALAGEDPASSGDALTDAVLANRDRLRFLNHTYQHRDLDVSAGADAEQARIELLWNRVMWDLLQLPDAAANAGVIVTGEHSGVWDDPHDGDPASQIPYPEGLNTAMAAAFEEAGIRYLAGDASEGNQAADQQVPGHDIVLLPRYPTGILLNAVDPDQQVDQYNWFFHERFIADGQDPCTIPAAVCEPVDYAEVLADEADLAVRHMLSFRRWPHYFHMANVVDYDGQGSTLLGDWLDAVMTEYESRSALPVENLTFAEIGARTEAELEARAANPVGVLDLETGEVVLAAGRAAELTVTGLAGGEPYGPVVQSTVSVGPDPVRLAIEG
ncbi:MAG: hypothetical protein ACE367_05625 [Acidimicrobiales bacterium]